MWSLVTEHKPTELFICRLDDLKSSTIPFMIVVMFLKSRTDIGNPLASVFGFAQRVLPNLGLKAIVRHL